MKPFFLTPITVHFTSFPGQLHQYPHCIPGFCTTNADFSNINVCLPCWKTHLYLVTNFCIWSTNLLARTVVLPQSGLPVCDQPATSPLGVLELSGVSWRFYATCLSSDVWCWLGLQLDLTLSSVHYSGTWRPFPAPFSGANLTTRLDFQGPAGHTMHLLSLRHDIERTWWTSWLSSFRYRKC